MRRLCVYRPSEKAQRFPSPAYAERVDDKKKNVLLTIYLRFFYRMRSFSHEVVQKHWASVDYHKNMSIIGLVLKKGHKEIIAIGTYAYEKDRRAEVAFVVREDFQGMGIASYLLAVLEKIAKENHYTNFSASVLHENRAMVQVFKKRYPNLKISTQAAGEVLIEMDLSDAHEIEEPSDQKP